MGDGGSRRRSAEQRTDPASLLAKLLRTNPLLGRLGDRRLRPSQSLALLVRSQDRRPLHRRRRAERARGDRLPAARRAACELRLGALRGEPHVREDVASEPARPDRVPDLHVHAFRRLLRHRRVRVPREGGAVCCRPLLRRRLLLRSSILPRRSSSRSTTTDTARAARSPAATSTEGKTFRRPWGGTSSATTARARSGACGSWAAMPPACGASLSDVSSISSFGEGARGELYLVSHEGRHLPARALAAPTSWRDQLVDRAHDCRARASRGAARVRPGLPRARRDGARLRGVPPPRARAAPACP